MGLRGGRVGSAAVPNVAVVSDTTAYLPEGVVEANDIRLVSLYVNFGSERTEREADIRLRPCQFFLLCTGGDVALLCGGRLGDAAQDMPCADRGVRVFEK